MNELDSYPPALGEVPKNDDTSRPPSEHPSPGEPPPEAAPAETAPAETVPGAAATVSASARRHPPYWFLFVLSFLTMAADLGSKAWAERRLDAPDGYPRSVELIAGNLDLVLAKNRGGAWGLLQDTAESIRRPFFLFVSVAAIAFIVALYRRLGPKQHALRWGLPLVLGGALGNLIDRIRYSYVIDFIHMHARWGGHDHHWPTYNVADIAICVGVGLMALDMLGSNRKQREGANAS
jgi:signal peptidase II